MYNVFLYAGERNRDGSFGIYISFSGNENEYLITQRPSGYIYKLMRNGITLDALERAYRENKNRRRSCEVKNTLKHILQVANDYIKYEYNYYKQQEKERRETEKQVRAA